ncbi:MAG: molybdate ABC transporter permease subunit, partial [Deltaproteobacteria bacterium]|nr:molybdate ABC transporter permease subunit [Deltaproteobacteria bacterium]
GVVLTFAHTLGEFGVVLMIGGNLSWRDVAHSLRGDLRRRSGLNATTAGQTSALLVALSL